MMDNDNRCSITVTISDVFGYPRITKQCWHDEGHTGNHRIWVCAAINGCETCTARGDHNEARNKL